MTEPVPVSGDQPDPRVQAIVDAMHWLPDSPHIDFLLRAIDVADRAAGIRRLTEEQARVSFHVPQIGQRSDGRWGVFCAACSAAIGDYVYPCPTWAAPFNEYPAILSEVGAP